MTRDLQAKIARLPNVLYSHMIPVQEMGPNAFGIYEAQRNENGSWDVSFGHRRDYGISTTIRIGMAKQIATGLDFAMMMDLMHRLETTHPDAENRRPVSGWVKAPYYGDYMKLAHAVMAGKKTSSAIMRRSRGRKKTPRPA